ncbi:hypothetical protein J4233_06140 [Candidatus Pacearchaeota archaeon]|nr:hypothetical protein [Candidatus Pacearchaeota archaeon]
MAKRCIYCKVDLSEDSVVDVCRRCGIGVWGEKMFNAIIENMEGAKKNGNLYQGSVSYSPDKKAAPKKSALGSIAQEALATQTSKPVERQLDSYSTQKAEISEEDSADFLVDKIDRY